jgi:hypothetical protein
MSGGREKYMDITASKGMNEESGIIRKFIIHILLQILFC